MFQAYPSQINQRPARSRSVRRSLAAGLALVVFGLLILTSPALAQVTITVPAVTGSHNDTVTVSVDASSTTGDSITAVELWISSDPGVAVPVDGVITSGHLTNNWSSATSIASGARDTLRMALATATDTLSGAGTLLQIQFVVADLRSPANTTLEIDHLVFNEGSPAGVEVDGTLTLIGVDGTVSSVADTIIPSDNITVTVTDADENRDAGSIDIVRVDVANGTDTETIFLNEDAVNSGVFSGVISTVFSLTPSAGDGIVQAQAGDDVTFSFADSIDTAGATVTRNDVTAVIGGVDGTVQSTMVLQAANGRFGLRDTMRVEVADADLDITGGADLATITVTNMVTLETETIVATETSGSSGVFQARIPTIAGASANEDAVLGLADGDTLSSSYSDVLNAIGGSSTRLDSTWAENLFSDMTGNGTVSSLDASSILSISVLPGIPADDTLRVIDLDADGDVLAFDASLTLEYVVFGIDWFPVRDDITSNHPFLKVAGATTPLIALYSEPITDGAVRVALRADDRGGLLSATAEIGLEDFEVVEVALAEELQRAGYLLAHHVHSDGVNLAFAGPRSDLFGPGDVATLTLRPLSPSASPQIERLYVNGRETVTELVAAALDPRQSSFQLLPNAPNPFNPSTLIRYEVAETADLRLDIYNLSGQRIRSLVAPGTVRPGRYEIAWDGRDESGRHVGSGPYLLSMRAGDQLSTRKILLLR